MSPQEYTFNARTIVIGSIFLCFLASVLIIFSGFFGMIGASVEFRSGAVSCAEYSMTPREKLPISCYDYFGFSKK